MKQSIKFLLVFGSVFLSTALSAQKNFTVSPMLKEYYGQKKAQNNLDEEVNFILKGDVNEITRIVEQSGGIVKFSKGNLVSVRVPLKAVEALSKSDKIAPIHFSIEKGVALNDTMRMRNRINEVHQSQSPLENTYTGKDVIVGFIDAGIDYTHPDFQNSDGTTRVLAIWDQTKEFDATYTPVEFGYGQVWDSMQINNGLSTHDILGTHHGSTVTGVSVGNGLASGDNMGVAPNADIVVVETNFATPNWFATVVDAVEYIFSVADSHGKSCVINASVGGYLGSHDGLDVEAKMISGILNDQPGRLMVCAGGNGGNRAPHHVRNIVTSDTTFTWFQYNSTEDYAYVDIWSDILDFDNVSFAIGADKVSPDFEFRGRTDFKNVKLDNMIGAVTFDSIYNGNQVLTYVEYHVTEDNGRYQLEVYMPNVDSTQYNFRFMATGSGMYDVWGSEKNGISELVSTGIPTEAVFPDIKNYIMPDTLQSIVTSWACSPEVITVANYVNAMSYVDYLGNTQVKSNPAKKLAPTSSKGPTRNGLIKPDIAATGSLTFSPGVVADVVGRRTGNPSKLHLSGWHVSNGGTSMASPVVAGIGALLLERCPNLSPQKFKEIITSTAFQDEFTGSVLPNYAFGYGKVDAFAALVSTLFTASLTDVVICDGETISFTSNEIYTSYKWHDNSTGSSILINSDVNGYLIAENEYGCLSDTTYFTVTVDSDPSCILSIPEKEVSSLIIYPNPASDHFNVQVNTGDLINVRMVDVLGKVIFTKENVSEDLIIDTQNLESATYFLIVDNDGVQTTSKISVVKD